VAEGAVVRDSVVLNDTVIEAGAVVDRCIIDKAVVVGSGSRIGDGDDNTSNAGLPEQINTGLTLIGKYSRIPEGIVIGRNVVVHANSNESTFGKLKRVPSGRDLGKNLR
jgi:glucose-1-phosphate adenylyltransferase